MVFTIDIPEDSNEMKALIGLRATFTDEQDFASFLLTAASFYSEDAFVDMFETLERRVAALEKKSEVKIVRTLGGKQVSG
jgi:hypothetical protein